MTVKGDFVQAMQFIANQDGPECTVRNGNGVDLRCDIRRVCRDAIDEIEQLRTHIASAPPPAVVELNLDTYRSWYARELTKNPDLICEAHGKSFPCEYCDLLKEKLSEQGADDVPSFPDPDKAEALKDFKPETKFPEKDNG